MSDADFIALYLLQAFFHAGAHWMDSAVSIISARLGKRGKYMSDADFVSHLSCAFHFVVYVYTFAELSLLKTSPSAWGNPSNW